MTHPTQDYPSPLPHPGDLPREDDPPRLGLSAGALAKAMKPQAQNDGSVAAAGTRNQSWPG